MFYFHVRGYVSMLITAVIAIVTFEWFHTQVYTNMSFHETSKSNMVVTLIANIFIGFIRSRHFWADSTVLNYN